MPVIAASNEELLLAADALDELSGSLRLAQIDYRLNAKADERLDARRQACSAFAVRLRATAALPPPSDVPKPWTGVPPGPVDTFPQP